MPMVIQVINLVDLVPSQRQVEITDPATFKTSAYLESYGFLTLRADFTRGSENELIGVTYTVVN